MSWRLKAPLLVEYIVSQCISDEADVSLNGGTTGRRIKNLLLKYVAWVR